MLRLMTHSLARGPPRRFAPVRQMAYEDERLCPVGILQPNLHEFFERNLIDSVTYFTESVQGRLHNIQVTLM